MMRGLPGGHAQTGGVWNPAGAALNYTIKASSDGRFR